MPARPSVSLPRFLTAILLKPGTQVDHGRVIGVPVEAAERRLRRDGIGKRPGRQAALLDQIFRGPVQCGFGDDSLQPAEAQSDRAGNVAWAASKAQNPAGRPARSITATSTPGRTLPTSCENSGRKNGLSNAAFSRCNRDQESICRPDSSRGLTHVTFIPGGQSLLGPESVDRCDANAQRSGPMVVPIGSGRPSHLSFCANANTRLTHFESVTLAGERASGRFHSFVGPQKLDWPARIRREAGTK